MLEAKKAVRSRTKARQGLLQTRILEQQSHQVQRCQRRPASSLTSEGLWQGWLQWSTAAH